MAALGFSSAAWAADAIEKIEHTIARNVRIVFKCPPGGGCVLR
jgi:hypothetical protein